MKIVILTGKFGMGHLKAAEAIKEELTALSVSKFTGVSYAQQDIENIEIVDWVEYLSPLCAKYIYGGYSRMIRCSMAFYNLHYKSSEKRPTDQKPSQILGKTANGSKTVPGFCQLYENESSDFRETAGPDHLCAGRRLEGRILL